MTTKITTDWHIGVRRVAGTTPATQQQLRDVLRAKLIETLGDNDHLIAGDLLDHFTVETSELIALYHVFSEWLTKYGRRLALLRGNHDFSMRGSAASSFDLLASILRAQFPEQVTVADEVMEWKQFVLVPHLPNNETLNIEVSKLKDVRDKVVVFHANIDNFFAAESQHSLCLNIEQIEDLVSRGNLVLCGHEHQYRELVNGRCVVLGNTYPSSIADCLGNSRKVAAYVTGTDIELEETWEAFGDYCEINWQELRNGTAAPDEHRFIRITGEAKADQSADVVNVVAKLRQTSDALVIGNAVKVEGQAVFDEMALESTESIKAFDVLSAIYSQLEPREIEIVKELLG
jgi:metallophosphoesterase superfamily enzyme